MSAYDDMTDDERRAAILAMQQALPTLNRMSADGALLRAVLTESR